MALSAARDDHGGRGKGRGRGRGRGGGRGNWYDDEAYDMDVSADEDGDPDDNPSKKRDGVTGETTGRVAMQVNLLEHPSQKNNEISPMAEQEKKRPRRTESGEDEDLEHPNARSVLSFEKSGQA